MGINIKVERFGETEKGLEVKKYTLENSNGMKVSVVDFGASIQSIIVPDKNGHFRDVALGYESVKDYEKDNCYLGALCGRVANRISNAQFTIDGETFHLSKNDGDNHIHGGFVGFNKKLFTSYIEKNFVQMHYTSVNGEEGYPGTLTVCANYTLNDDNELNIHYAAVTTRPTAVNLVQHTYFNLAGHDSEDVYDHTLIVNADKYTPKKPNGYPTGEIQSVDGTVFDFRKPRRIGADIDKISDDIGYDHNLCLNAEENFAAKLTHPESGRVLVVKTNQPGLQVYTANYLNGERGKDGVVYKKHGAICLETQNYPDAINQPNFPNAVDRPEEGYHHDIIYKFSTE